MSINADYLSLASRLAAALPAVAVQGMHLPQPVPDETFRDEFGFVFLTDGSVGPFYVSLGDLLRDLWARFPDPPRAAVGVAEALQGFVATNLSARALALGVYNALSRSLMRNAGFAPPDRPKSAELARLASDDSVGMVGYFCPVVDRLSAAGIAVRVLERAPQRVPKRAGVEVVTRPEDLRGCRHILCTSSVLINDTLDELLGACAGAAAFELIGPSGSGIPDALFERGVAAVGGIVFDDPRLLLDTLQRHESWGRAGRKYQLLPADYPGVDALLSRLNG